MLPILIACLAAVAAASMRLWCEMAEARQLRLTDLLLRPGIRDEKPVEPDEVEVLLERTRMLLSAVRLLRIASLLVLLPTVTWMVFAPLRLNFVDVATGSSNWFWGSALPELLAGLGLYLVMALPTGVLRSRGRSTAESLARTPPEWLTDDDENPPVGVVVGWSVWEKVIGFMGGLLRPLGIERPYAQLIEVEDKVRLSLVVREEEDDDQASPHDEAQANGNGNGEHRTEDEMVAAIQRLDRTFVREIMKPVNQVTAVRLRDCTARRLLALCRRTGYTRIPVYEDHILNLTGYLNVYDILEQDPLPRDLRPLVMKPLFVPEVARVDHVLLEMIARKQQVVIVFDEFGGTSGWLSREDILEEIVGELEDEYERPRQKILPVKGGYLVDGALDLDDLEDEVGLDLTRPQCDTVAGYIYLKLGRAPRRGELLEEDGWKIRVASIEGHRIRRVRLIAPLPMDGEE